MLTETDLKKLISYRPVSKVLSVYLNLDPSSGPADAHKLRLRQLLKQFEASMPEDTRRLERFVDFEYDWSGRSLALFSCAEDDFFESFSLPLPVRDRARALNRPYVKPIADLLENYGNYGVAVVDQQGARLIHIHLGEPVYEEKVSASEVRRTKRGGGSQSPGRRGGTAGQTGYAEELADRNLKEIAKKATRFFQDHRVRRVLVGGTEITVARFIQALPKKWQSLVIGSFPMDITAGTTQILESALQTGQTAEKLQETKLVEALITSAAKGQAGVVGLDETLSNVHGGRVQTLVISEGFRAPGYRCTGCGYLVGQNLETCRFCGNSFEEIEDAVELALRLVIESGGEVEVVRDSSQLDHAGKIGGFLRY